MDRLLLLVFFAPRVHCYSSGQIMESCNDMTPHHGIRPQTESAPFSITTDRSSYQLGEEVTVQLRASSSRLFTGFLLQAREVAGLSPVGSFRLTLGGAQLLVCNQRPNSAVSHNSASGKTFIEVMWKADTSGDGKPIHFRGSFVENFRTFWVDVPSLVLTYVNDTSLPTPPITSSTPQLPINEPQPALQDQTFSGAECGVTKLCFSQPSDCDPAVSKGCYFMSVVRSSPTDPTTRYEMMGSSNGYIAIGFSDDQIMGNDDIYICGRDSDGQVTLQRAYSTGQTVPQSSPLGNVSDVRASTNDGVIRCSFTSYEPISIRTAGFNKDYHLMFACGPSSRGQIQIHTGTFISAVKVDISRPQTVAKARWPKIIKAHGAMMLTAWMTSGSLGMIVARFLRGVTKGRQLMGKDIWFLVHIALMIITIVITIIAFILPFSYAKHRSEGAHLILGCLVMILSSLQSLLAFMRCGPQHPLRFLFNWSHAVNAVVIKTLAVAAVFTGLRMIDSAPDQWLLKVMGGFVGWEVLFYILMEVYSKCRVSRTDTLKSDLMSAILLLVLYSLGNLSFLVALLVGINLS